MRKFIAAVLSMVAGAVIAWFLTDPEAQARFRKIVGQIERQLVN